MLADMLGVFVYAILRLVTIGTTTRMSAKSGTEIVTYLPDLDGP